MQAHHREKAQRAHDSLGGLDSRAWFQLSPPLLASRLD
jgi:hypothetical protein